MPKYKYILINDIGWFNDQYVVAENILDALKLAIKYTKANQKHDKQILRIISVGETKSK